MFNIGPYSINQPTILAPMAGISDLPFRQLCRSFGAGLVISEMLSSDTRLWGSRKSQQRLNKTGEAEPRSVQIAGADADMMAQAAQINVEQGAQIIDINMGCPAKKVCKKAAGSALLKDETLVKEILENVVSAVSVPVTLKFRTGWDTSSRNAVQIAKIAEQAGIQALALHGRTRACAFRGQAEYDCIAEVKDQVDIPVFANGDIDSPEKAKQILEKTGADAVMIGRAARGKPWIFQQINHYLATGAQIKEPNLTELQPILKQHIEALHHFYGEYLGVRIARKHLRWYLEQYPNGLTTSKHFNKLQETEAQLDMINQYFQQLTKQLDG